MTPPKPQEEKKTVHCWESEEIKALNCDHNCNKCLIFKKKIDLCFLSVREYGSLKVQCKQDCMSCAYLKEHHPQERRMLLRQRSKAAGASANKVEETSPVNGILKKVFYNSGRLVAKIGQLSKGPEPKRRIKRTNKSVRKG